MKNDTRTIEDLLGAIEKAPTFGLNARELILQASRRIAAQEGSAADDDKISSRDMGKQKQLFLSLYKKGGELLGAVPTVERPLVPYKAIQRSKVPRITRQAVLDRLAGQHLALALHQGGKHVSSKEIRYLGDKRKEALLSAVEQEESIYQRGKASKAVYLNYASRVNADTTMKKPEAQLLTDAPAEAGLQAMASQFETPAQEDDQPASSETAEEVTLRSPMKRRRKEPPAALVEADIDWDAKVNEHSSPTEIAHNSTSSKALDSAAGGIAEGRQADAHLLKGDAAQGKSSPERCQHESLTPDEDGASNAQKARLPPVSEAAQLLANPVGDPWDKGKGSGQECKVWAGRAHTNTSKSQDNALLGSHSLSAAAMEEYSPSRHGGESPPWVHPGLQEDASHQKSQAANMSSLTAACPPGDPKVAAALAAFLRTHLDPLYQAKVIDRQVYKAAMQKTVEKVMRGHIDSTDAKFLIREGAKIQKLLMQYVEKLTESCV